MLAVVTETIRRTRLTSKLERESQSHGDGKERGEESEGEHTEMMLARKS